MTGEHATLGQLLFKSLKLYEPSVPCLNTKRGGIWYSVTAESFQQQVRNFALGLYSLGVRKGDRVSIHSENSIEWILCDLATMSMGAVNVPIYTTQPGDQIKFILENSEAMVHIVSNDGLFAETKPLIKGISSVKAVITMYGSQHGKLKHMDEIIENGRQLDVKEPHLFDELTAAVEAEDLATLIYTSGTTGQPKGVMLTHANITSNVKDAMKRLPFTLKEVFDQPVLSYLPLSHIFERVISYMYLMMQVRIHYIQNIEEIRDDFIYVKPYFFATVPRLLEKIQTGVKVKGQELSGVQKKLYYWALGLTEAYDPEHPPKGLAVLKHSIADKLIFSKIRPLFGGNLKGVVTGGAALPPEIFRFMNAIGLFCGQGYGLTETSPVITVQDPTRMRVGSSGMAIDNVEVKIAEDGEICARGSNIMQGYYKNPEATAEVIDKDGWFKTGDIGRLDEDGYLYITDRKKALFKLSTGKYVAPQNVENRIVISGFIDQIVVIGSERKFCAAIIVPAYDNILKRLHQQEYHPHKPYSADAKVRELIQKEVEKGNEGLPKWEQVKRFILLEEPLTIASGELTPTLKVKRPVVREKYAAQIEELYKSAENEATA